MAFAGVEMSIEIDPDAIRNAGKGLDKFVVPDLKKLNDRMLAAYPITFPGFGLALLAVEGYYNEVCMYHAGNLKAGSAVAGAVADGLFKTAENWQTAETVNATGFMAPPGKSDTVSWTGGLGATSWATQGDLSKSSGAEATTAIIEWGLLAACEVVALGCAALSPPFLVVPIVFSGLMANFTSIWETSRDIREIASDLGSPTIAQFHDITLGPNGAVSGWKDTSVQEFTRKVEEILAELDQTKECLYLVAEFLTSLLEVLSALWVAFIAFIPPFFAALSTLDATGVGVTVSAVLGAMATAGWTTVLAIVMGAIAGLVTLISGFFGNLASLHMMDSGRDGVPDLQQIKIEWAST
jgi:hypothetical protein